MMVLSSSCVKERKYHCVCVNGLTFEKYERGTDVTMDECNYHSAKMAASIPYSYCYTE